VATVPAKSDPASARPSLTREAVATAALELADREGLDGLSMRRLAEALGVGTMTLYGYFRSKRELLAAVVDAAVSDRPLEEPEGDWRARLLGLVMGARQSLVHHPALVEIRVRQPVLEPEALRFAEAALRILRDAGFDRREATLAFRLLFSYSLGFAAFSPAEAVEEDRAAAGEALRALPPGEYPELTSTWAEAAQAMGGEEAFEYGLERILDGLESRLRETLKR
jgi:AcrR family transcriptional regulator